MGQGLDELGDRLGPILWQFMATKKFDPDDFEAFLKLLPKTLDGLPLAPCGRGAPRQLHGPRSSSRSPQARRRRLPSPTTRTIR